MSLNVGMVVDDRYLLEAQIGSGGMARVFRATNRKNGKRVALKEIYLPANDTADTLRGWFRRELKALMLIDHPNVLQLVDHGETVEGIPYVVTELLEGMDLEDVISARGPMNESVLVDVALQSLSAFETAHGMSVVHRDVKPGNLYLCNNGRLVVLDFGLARAMNQEVSSTLAQGFDTKILGTPQYWSPEQIKGVTLDTKSDIFSLGGTLYFLASGQQPYPGKTPFEIASQIMMKKRRLLGEVAPKLDAKVTAAIEAMLAEDGTDRPSAADALKLWRNLEQKYPDHAEAARNYVTGGAAFDDLETDHSDQTNIVTGSVNLATPTQITVTPPREANTAITQIPSGPPLTPIFPQDTGHTAIVTVSATQPSSRAVAKKSPVLPIAIAASVLLVAGAVVFALMPSASPKPPIAIVTPPPPPVPNDAPPLPVELPAPNARVDVPAVPKQTEQPEDAAPRRKVEPATGPGVLNCSLRQWAELFVDGKSMGKQQLGVKLSLPAGKHEVLFKNSKLGEKRAVFTIRAGKETPCKVDFLSNDPI